MVNLAIELGYLQLPAGIYVELNKTKNIPDSQLVIITTGSQGEPMSALSRMANNEHRNVKLKKGDMVIFSSSPVPGNEKDRDQRGQQSCTKRKWRSSTTISPTSTFPATPVRRS